MALTRRTEGTNTGGSGAAIPNLPEGEHEGRLVYVADLGLQVNEYKGEVKPDTQQIALGVEIVGQTIELDGKTVPRFLWTKPFNIFSTMTEKGRELKFYSVFDSSANEGEVPDWDGQLGSPCTVVVKHANGNDGAVFDNISSLLPIPAKYQDGVELATLDFGIGDSEDPDDVVNKALFGLAKWVFDRRIGAQEKVDEAPKADTEDGPY